MPAPVGDFATYGTRGFIFDFSYNQTYNNLALAALKNEQWFDYNTRGILIVWTVGAAYTNAYYEF